jgi:hypothetical protein
MPPLPETPDGWTGRPGPSQVMEGGGMGRQVDVRTHMDYVRSNLLWSDLLEGSLELDKY